MEKWRKYFECSGVDAWTVCERALTVAFFDNAEAFVARRDKLAQKLFAPEKMDPKACEADAPSLSCFASSLNRIPSEKRAPLILKNRNGAEEEEEEEDDGKDEDGDEIENGENLRRIVEISPDEAYDEVEALSEEMEQEVLFRRDAIRIKEMLDSHEILSEKEILESLDRLNLMELSVEILKDTEIGHTVNRLRKNTSTRVKSLAKKLVRDWKDLVNEWVKSVENVANAALEGTPASVSPDDDMAEDHGGLPSPPIDEAALLAASQTAPMEMSQLFDFMDDDDDSLFNSQGGGGRTGKPASDRRSSNLSNSILTNIKSSATSGGGGGEGMEISERESKQNKEKGPPLVAGEGGIHRTKSGGNSGGIARNGCSNNVPPARPSISNNEYIKEKVKPQICGSERNVVAGGRTSLNLAKANASAYVPKDDDYHERLLVSKRKLQQNYQQAQIVKKQRTVQVMDLQDLPKGGAARAPFNRPKSSSSHFLSANKHSSQHQSWACR